MRMNDFLLTFLAAGQAALDLIGRAVLPVLFPFFVITGLIINLTNTSNKFVVAGLAYLSGYPNGTRLTKLLYDKGLITPAAAQHLSVLTSTPSPIFVVATVGTIFLQNTLLGIVIFLCAVLGAVINSWLWRPPRTTQHLVAVTTKTTTRPNFFAAFNQAMANATAAIINVCGVVLFFFVLTKLLHLPVFLTGLLEMTTGVAATLNPLLIEFFVCFGGLSVAIQNLLFAESFHLKFSTYLGYKLTHAVIACGLLAGCLFFF